VSKSRLYTILGATFGLVGTVLLTVSVALGASTVSFLVSADRTDGTVTDMVPYTTTKRDYSGMHNTTTLWRPVVEFRVDDQEYTFQSSVGTSPPAHRVGDTVSVAYDPDDPSDARLASFGTVFLVPLITGGIGLVFAPIGAVFVVLGRRHKKLRAWLFKHGREVWATVAEVRLDTSTRINGRSPYVVHATWTDRQTGRTYTAVSDYLRDDPGPSLERHKHIRVRYDVDDPERNLVDLESVHLPEPGGRPA
jgi:hypothetical protein